MEAILAAYLMAQAPRCAPTGVIEQELASKYGESIVAAGIVPGARMFTLANPKTGSFTVLLVRPDGLSCLLMGGHGFTTIEATKPGTET